MGRSIAHPAARVLVSVAALLAAGVPQVCAAESGAWVRWPAGREDYEPSCEVPPGFRAVPPLAGYDGAAPLSLNARFRSEDGSVEFAVTAISARGLPQTAEARAIPLPLLPGERIVSREPRWKTSSVGGEEVRHFSENISVAGPANAYMRYFLVELSTGNLPLSSSLLWEFKAADEKARKAFQSTYRRFKNGVNLGED